MRAGFVLYKGMWSSKVALPDSEILTDEECKKMLMGAVNVLYPFRKLIKHHRRTALLNMEAMARGKY